MPQRRELTWKQLRVGALIGVGLILFAVGIFFISGQIGFLSRKITVRAYFSTAGGLRPGSEVHLAGIPAGNVTALGVSRSADPSHAVEVVMKVAQPYASEVRTDSTATATTAGLLGDTYVDITRGTPGQPALQDGGVVQTHEEADIKQIVQNTNDVISNLRGISVKLNDITNQISSGKGSLGKVMYDATLYNQMSHAVGTLDRMATQIEGGNGTMGKLLYDQTAYNKLMATLDHANDLMDEIQKGNGTVGRLVADPTLYNNLKDSTDKLNALLDNINKGQGSLGKLAKDSELYDRLNKVAANLNVITERMSKGEGSLGKLSTDTTLYNNLTASSDSLKEFLAEFRKNPKKYLSIKLHVF